MKKLLLAFCLTMLPLSSAFAYDQGLLNRIESRLNQITTMKSPFEQYNKSGQKLTGTFYLSRPGKMRINYDPPIYDFIVATGNRLIYWDDSMQQKSHTSIGSTLADVILRKDINFGGRLKVCGLKRNPNRFIKVCLQDTENLDQGTFTIYVHPSNYDLLMWKIKDNLGNETAVRLTKPVYNIKLDSNLFQFTEPEKRW